MLPSGTLPRAVLSALLTLSSAVGGDPGEPPEWRLPLIGGVVVAPFEAPPHEYGAGHRGVDVASGTGDDAVVAPADGVVAFAGRVVDRAVVTVDHGDGWVTSIEPVDAEVDAGDVVTAGERIGTMARGGHALPGTVHVGVRVNGAYVNPLLLLGRIPRAVLLPCC